jgi:hypothetical protein
VPATPPDKICATCGRPFAWRKKWAKDWPSVRYCSKACKGGPGARGEALEQAILGLLDSRRPGETICPSEAAREVDREGWRELMEPARQAARRLVHAGRVEITQGGRAVDPGSFRGPIRIRRAG